MVPTAVGRTKRGHCPICNKQYRDENMAECANCKKRFCYECVNVTDEDNESWLCPNCATDPNQQHVVQPSIAASSPTLIAPQNPSSSSTKSSSKHTFIARSKKNSTSSSKRKLKLQLIQEELNLIRKERELTKEARLLIEESDDSQDIDDEEVRAADPAINILLSQQIEQGIKINPAHTLDMCKPVQKDPSKYPTHQKTEIEIPERLNMGKKGLNDYLSYEALDQNTLTPQECAARRSIPKELPSFSGNTFEWPLFISSYKRSTQLCGYDNNENLLRLQKSLKGTAKSAVFSLLTVPEYVPQIISTLEMLFGRPEQIINAHINSIRQKPPPKSEKIETLVEYALSIKNLCVSLENSNMSAYLNNPTLMFELVEKLPPQTKINWAIYRSTLCNFNGLKDFGDWMYNIAMNVCTALPSLAVMDRDRGKSNRQNERSYQHLTESANQQKICKICSGNFIQITDCKTFQEYPISDKWKCVRDLKLCRLCLKRHRFPCKYPVKCNKDGCQRKHHPKLHKDIESQPSTTNSNSTTQSQQEVNVNLENNQSIRFRILPVRLTNGNKEVLTYAFMDEGSSITMLDETIAEELGVCGEYEPLCLKWTGDQERLEEKSQRILYTISGDFPGARRYENRSARTVKNLHLPKQSLDAAKLVKGYPYLKNVSIKSYKNVTPRLLIGLDNWELALPLKVKEGEEGQPIAAKCRLGWTAFALHNQRHINTENIYHICECNDTHISNQDLHELIKKYFCVESLGVTAPANALVSKELKRATEIMESTIKQVENHYEIGLIWKYDNLKLPYSSPMAIRRLKCIEQRKDSYLKLAIQMNQQITDFIEKGYIRKLTAQELAEPHKRIWYLPIFPTFNPNKPGKFRIVWDAAAKVDGISLNSMLLKGDDQLGSLLGILFRFRERKIGFSADIKEMFLRVGIRSEDQHAQRFYWRNKKSEPLDTYIMTVMTFGATCSPSCAQFVKNFNARKFIDQYPRAVKSIIENHYVDDLLDTADTLQEALNIAEEVKFIHSNGNFEIRNWRSNSEQFMQIMNSSSETPTKINMNIESEETTEKVLGMWWNLKLDCFTYSLRFNKGNIEVLSGKRRPTKREVLRILMSVYDPLGLIAHFLIYVKILLQEIWRSKIDWDDPITNEQFEKWLLWLKYLPDVEGLAIPRCYLSCFFTWDGLTVQLHIFVDASNNAMACVAYLRMEKIGAIECVLIGAKTRVAPIKIQTIPRLELDAALIGTRLATNICNHLSVSICKTTYWSDSITVLSWIRNEDPRKLGKSVAYRVAEIQENSVVSNWRYVPTKLNIADEATKWSKPPILKATSSWFTGPDFLYESETFWPADADTVNNSNEDVFNIHEDNIALINIQKFSTYMRLLHTMGTVIRFVNLMMAKIKSKTKPSGTLTSEEIKRAEYALIRTVQNMFYSEEIKQLQKGKETNGLEPTVNKSSSIYKLSPYLDHIAYQHQNHETVVNEIRQKYYVPKLRRSLLNIRSNCPICKLRLASPNVPEMSPLPECRLAVYTAPFTFTAVDYFGPINVMVGRRVEKRWGALFSCLTTRAVHMEMAYKIDADSFILCLKNFINRRGQPRHIHCDRGSNFIGAERLLREELQKIDPQLILKSFVSPQISFEFNSPLSPHMAGAWERLVKAVKIALYGALPTRTPTDPLLISCLIAAENIVNSRPLTYMPLDSEESEALTPNHFLVGSSSGEKPMGQLDDSANILKGNYLYREQFANRYWKRFVAEYIPELLLRFKWFKQTRPLKEGDIVIICDKDLPRCNWPKGKVIEVTKAKDGQVRKAKVQTATGVYERPVVKLALLSIKDSENGTAHSLGSAVPGKSVKND